MKKVIVCVNHRVNPDQPSCAARGAEKIAARLETEIAERQLPLVVERFNCLGLCDDGPNLRLAPNGCYYKRLTLMDFQRLMDEIRQFADADEEQGVPVQGV